MFRLGLGGRMGSGRQYWSWISLRDEVRALEFLADRADLSGAVNLVAPQPSTNAEITAAMGRVLGRPTLFPVPALALKTVLGEFSSEVLGSVRVLPTVLEQNGFAWLDPTISSAIRAALD
jgi:NAD dependent epimerase/dehydratase family enzyme